MIQLDDQYVYSSENDQTHLERSHSKKAFYAAMKENGFDFDDVDDDTRLPNSLIPVVAGEFEALIRFNLALETIHRNGITNMVDALVYLTEDYFEEKELINLIQTNNLKVTVQQAKMRKRTNKPKTALKKFLK